MEYLFEGVRDAVHKGSWYPAIALALALPDICASVEHPGRGQSTQRYIRWIDRWAQSYFSDATGKIFLSGRDLFGLRCAFLHGGDFVTGDGIAQAPDDSAAMFEVLNRVTFYTDANVSVVPARTMAKGGSERTTGYAVGVGWFCEKICSAAEAWLGHARQDPTFARRIEQIAQAGMIIDLFDRYPV